MNLSRNLFCLLLLTFVTCSVTAQRANLDSLLNSAKISREDSSKVILYNDISYEFRNSGNIEKAFEFANKALQLSQKINYTKGLASSYNSLGLINSGIGAYSKALEMQFLSLKYHDSLKDVVGVSINYGNIGVAYKELADYEKALEYYKRALKINLENNRKVGLAANYGNMGLIYSKLKDYSKALEYYQNSLKISEELKNKTYIGNNLMNIAGVYFNIGEAYKASNKNNSEYDSLFRLSLKFQSDALKIFEESGNNLKVAGLLGNLGALYLEMDQLEEAENYLLKSNELAESINHQEALKNNYKALSELYEKKSLFEKSNFYYKKHITIRDTLNNDAVSKNSLRVEMQYNFDKQEAISKAEIEKSKILLLKNQQDLLLLKKENELNELTLNKNEFELIKNKTEKENAEKTIQLLNKDRLLKEAEARQKEDALKQQKFLTYLSSGIGILILASLLLALKGYLEKKRANQIISSQKLLVEKQKDEVENQRNLLEEKNKEITDSINYAKRIQSALLLPEDHVSRHLPEHFIFFKPKDIVSGDFYWANEQNGYLYIIAADCTGHGVPGAFMSMLGISYLNEIVKKNITLTPSEILNELRDKIISNLNFKAGNLESRDGMDAALCRIDLKTNELLFSGANNGLYLFQEDNFLEVKGDKQPVGYFIEEKKKFTDHHFNLNKGDSFYIFTDGYADQFGGEKGKKFKYKQLLKLFSSIKDIPADNQKTVLNDTFETWKGNLEQVDDVCVIGVRI
jgi:serine phosphatase RsbU (regulator of sigma subunit)/tetratricopeptide (TPR) repeat protein